MLDHVSTAVPDLGAARRFYVAVTAALGVPAAGRDAGRLGHGERCDAAHPGSSYLSVRLGAASGAEAGRHLAFKAPDRRAVDRFWRAGLDAGGADDGAPGVRAAYHAHYCAAFLRGPDGNRIEAVCHREPPR